MVNGVWNRVRILILGGLTILNTLNISLVKKSTYFPFVTYFVDVCSRHVGWGILRPPLLRYCLHYSRHWTLEPELLFLTLLTEFLLWKNRTSLSLVLKKFRTGSKNSLWQIHTFNQKIAKIPKARTISHYSGSVGSNDRWANIKWPHQSLHPWLILVITVLSTWAVIT